MKDPIKQMLASIMAARLGEEIAAFEENEGGSTWLRPAANALHPNDLNALVAETKRLHAKYLKDAAGCPPRVFQWSDFFDGKAPNACGNRLADNEPNEGDKA